MKLRLTALFLSLCVQAAAARPNIVMVSIDTLRADRLGCYGYQGKTSPFLDSMAAQGLVFEEAYVPLPSTSPSHASLLTSLLPWRHGSMANAAPMTVDVETLPQALKRLGYRTAGVVGVQHLGQHYGFARGFDDFSEPKAERGKADGDLRRPAADVNAMAKQFVERHLAARSGQPLFLFIHYFDVHYPYRWWDPAEKNDRAWDPKEQADRPRQSARYDDGVRHTDRAVRDLYEFLVRQGLGRELVLVVTSDHGEQIGDHGFDVGHADIYRETVRVPLLMMGPGLPKKRIATPVSSMDVGVTLLGLAGGRYQRNVDGIPLGVKLGTARPRPLLVIGNPLYTQSVALIDGPRWYIRNLDYLYRYVATSAPAPGTRGDGRTWHPAPLHGSANGTATYRIPFSRYEPYVLTVDHVARDPACRMKLNVVISPVTAYLVEELAFQRSARVTVPAARNDAINVDVNPASCAGTTMYSVSRYEGTASIPQRERSRFFEAAVPRKNGTKDELYDVASDPRMLYNILPFGGAPRWERRVRAIVDRATASSRDRHAAHAYSDEEKKKLKSLGYIH